MKAAVWHARNDVRVEEYPDPPSPPAGQVKIEVKWCGICGTDLHEYIGGPLYIPTSEPHPMTGAKAPLVLGHEMAGEVVEVGPDVSRVSIGDRVALCPIIGCQECEYCRSGLMGLCPNIAFLGISWSGGGFAQFVNVHDYMCYRLPSEVSYEIGALVEPFAATVRAVKKANVKPGETVAVVGSGAIGLMALQAAKVAGAGQVVVFETAARRQELALQTGASALIDPVKQDPLEAIADLTNGEGADVVIECAGVEATGILAGQVARRMGRVIVMGVFEKPALLNYTDLVYGEKTISGSMGGYGIFDEAIRMMADGRFNGEPLITGRIGLDEILELGFKALVQYKEANVKILVSPD